jgi:hypothetical protein
MFVRCSANEPTLFENRPRISALDHINANSHFSFGLALDGVRFTHLASNKLNFVFRNEYFEPLEGGFCGRNAGLRRVRKNDRFVEPMLLGPPLCAKIAYASGPSKPAWMKFTRRLMLHGGDVLGQAIYVLEPLQLSIILSKKML